VRRMLGCVDEGGGRTRGLKSGRSNFVRRVSVVHQEPLKRGENADGPTKKRGTSREEEWRTENFEKHFPIQSE